MLDFTTRSRQRLLPAALIALLSLACVGEVGSPTLPTDVQLRIFASWDQSLNLKAAGLVIDQVTATVWALPDDTVANVSQNITPDQTSVQLPVSLPVSGENQDFGVSVMFLAGGQTIFEGQDTVQIGSGATAVDLEIEFDFVGPGGDIAFMFVEPSDTTVLFGVDLQMRLEAFDGNESPVDPYFVNWSTDDATVAIDAAGVLTAGSTRSSVLVTATAPNGISANATVSFQPPPASVEAVTGDGATAAAGANIDLVARVLGSDGMPLGGVEVAFVVGSGGGSVNPATVTSDASGLAGATATLGTTPGTQTFEAQVTGASSATFTVEAILSEPVISLSPASLSFSANEGSNPSPASQTVTVTNSGNEQLNWTAADDQNWMSVSPTSGSLAPSQSATLTVTVSSASLGPATYSGAVTVSDPAAANSPQSVAVELTVSPPEAAIGLSPDPLEFTVTQGANPPTQQLTVTNIGGQPMSWSAADNQAWLALSPTSGSLNASQSANVTATVTSAALAPGTYTATVTVTSAEAVNSPQTMTVRLIVSAPPATISLSPTTMSFSAQQGSNPSAQTLTIGNTGGSTLNWSGTDNQTWLSLGTTSGSVAPSGSANVTVNVSSASLTTGTYQATITITDGAASNSPQTVAVELTVTPGPPTISLSPSALSFSAQAGSNPAAQNMTVGNTGGTVLNWAGTDNQPWLSLGTTSGSVAPAGSATVAVNVSSSTLAPGTYNGTITITDAQATNSPQTVAVTLTVTVAPGTIALTPATLFFTTDVGTDPSDQPMLIENTGSGALNWTGTDNQPWLSLGTTSGTIPAVDSTVVFVQVSSASLAEGSYSGTITISDPGATNSPQTLAVELDVRGVPSIGLSRTSMSFTAPEGSDPFVPFDTFTVTNTGTGTLNWAGAPLGGSWASLDIESGSLGAGQSDPDIGVVVSSSDLSPGAYTDSIRVSDPNADNSPQWLPLALSITEERPVVFNPSESVIEFFDAVHCTLGSFVGDRYLYTFDWTDDDGDGDVGPLITVMEFDTIGDGEVRGPAVYDTDPPFFFETTDGFTGSIEVELCIAFLDFSDAIVQFVVEDGGGNQSDTLTFVTAQQGGGPGPAAAMTSSSSVRPSGRAGDTGAALGSSRTRITRRIVNRNR